MARLAFNFFEWFGSFTSTLLICEFVGRISNEFNEIGYLIEQFDWYLFPIEMLRMLPIILLNTQQLVTFKCFGTMACDRETFGKVNLESMKKMSKIKLNLK